MAAVNSNTMRRIEQGPVRLTRSDVRQGKLDGATLLGILLLQLVGLIALFSASYAVAYFEEGDGMFYIKRQALFAAVGVFGMLVASNVSYRVIIRFQKPLFVVSLLLLPMTKIPGIGVTLNSASRWIKLGPLGTFQPSELVKLAVVLSFSYYAVQMGSKIRTFRYGILPFAGALAVIAGLLWLQPHASATVIICVIGMSILFTAGIRIWYFIPLGIAGGVFGVFYYFTHEHIKTRLSIWLDPFQDALKSGWQAVQSQIAIGSGGFWGLGLGQGRQKHLYLPEPMNDFVFSSWCEEMGFIGAVLVILLFAYVIYRGYYIALHAPDKLSCLIAVGLTTKLAVQTLVNLCVVTGLFPVTGAALPFFSYGGTALILQLGEMGILLNISRYLRPSEKRGERRRKSE